MEKTWGKHLIIDAYGIEERKLKDLKAIRTLFGNLLKTLKMRPLSNIIVKKVITDYYPDWGVSAFVMLYESHISIHTWPEESYVAMDIYSCKDFNHKEVINFLKKYLGYKKMKIKMITRG